MKQKQWGDKREEKEGGGGAIAVDRLMMSKMQR